MEMPFTEMRVMLSIGIKIKNQGIRNFPCGPVVKSLVSKKKVWLPLQGMRVQSQVLELRFHVSWGQKIKT